jgi:hypothetical protein
MQSIQVNISEKSSDPSASRKRKHIQTKLSSCSELVKKELPTTVSSELENQVIFAVQSATDPKKSYNINIINGYQGVSFKCDCGDQWNINPPRNNCKHIGGVISNLIKEYVMCHTLKSSSKQQRLDKDVCAKIMDEVDISMDSFIDQFKNLLSVD